MPIQVIFVPEPSVLPLGEFVFPVIHFIFTQKKNSMLMLRLHISTDFHKHALHARVLVNKRFCK